MGGLAVHLIDGIDLNYVDPVTSDFFVEDMGNPPEERISEEYVTLGDGAGARLASYEVGEAPMSIFIIALGDTEADAEAKLGPLQDAFDRAANGEEVVYEYKESDSMTANKTWRILRGTVLPRWRTGAGEQLFGLGGRATSYATLSFTLSKN
jgi:hypothetical protein